MQSAIQTKKWQMSWKKNWTLSLRSTEESIVNQNSFRVLSILYITNFSLYITALEGWISKPRSGEHIGISHLTIKKTKPSNQSVIHNHLLNCRNVSSFKEFNIFANRNNKFVLEIIECFLTQGDRSILKLVSAIFY